MSLPQPVKPLPPADLQHVLVHTSPLWESLRGGRLLITGATGFFGMWLLETFAYANRTLVLDAELVGLTREPESFRAKAPHLAVDPSIKLHQGDVRSFEFPNGKFTHCIHAATSSSDRIPAREMLETIILGTTRTLDFAVKAGVKRFLYVSSGAVYGHQPPELSHIPEDYSGAPNTMNPASSYGEGKRIAELLCSIFFKDHAIETIVARCFAFVGPHLPLDGHFAIGNFIRDALAKKPIQIKGDGTPLRSYLYAADLAIWLWTILFKGQAGAAYNVGSPDFFSISQIAEAVALASNLPLPSKKPSPGQELNFKSSRYIPLVTKAKENLSLYPMHNLTHSIQKTALYFSD